jgi:hypothetical protein
VEVRDSQGHVASATVGVVPVTTAIDEATTGATPSSPAGTGLSLREALAWVKLQPTPPKAIVLKEPFTSTITGGRLQLDAPGAAVVANAGAVLAFPDLNQPCLTLNGADQRLVGLTLRGCDSAFVTLSSASGGSHVAWVTTQATNPTKLYWAYGIDAQSNSTTTSRIGPGNDLSGLWVGIRVDGTHYDVFGNRVHDNALGAKLGGGPTRLWQNTFTGGVKGPSLVGIGVEISTGLGPVLIANNAFDGNAGDGLTAAAVASLTVRNNLFTGNGSFGLTAQPTGLVLDHNGYFGNASGPVSSGLATGATDLLVDPLYVDAPGGDLRLLPASPAIDAGVDVGIDLNGPGAGRFDGAAPDLGATEER